MSFNEWKYVKVKDIAEIIFSGGTPSTQKAELEVNLFIILKKR